MSILLRDGLVVTQNADREVFRGSVLVEDGLIKAVGREALPADEVIDCGGCAIIPGLINAHNHVANTILRGLVDDVPLEEMLERSFAYDAKLTRRDVQLGAMVGCLEMLRSGTTTFLDHFYWEDEVARAVAHSGIRAVLAWVVLDEEKTTQKGNPLKNAAAFIRGNRDLARITPAIALQGVYACSEETFLGAKELAEAQDTPLHMHLSETRVEVYEHQKKTGRRPPEWLDGIGFLCDRLSAAHCVWLTVNEIRLLAKAGVKVAHCPASNMKLASGGYAPLPEMFREGVAVGLGTDSPLSNNSLDIFAEMKLCALMHKAHRWDATVIPAQKALDMATIDAARVLGLERRLGSVEVGKAADLVVVDLGAPNLTPTREDNVVSNLVYSCTGGNVVNTLVDGNVVLRDRVIRTADEAEVLSSAAEAAAQLVG
jgi:5-methylthioadenosine/S-adenosylhomocysteine deaminase